LKQRNAEAHLYTKERQRKTYGAEEARLEKGRVGKMADRFGRIEAIDNTKK